MAFNKKKKSKKPYKPFDPAQLPPVPKYVPKYDLVHYYPGKTKEEVLQEVAAKEPQKVYPVPQRPKPMPKEKAADKQPKYTDPEKEFLKAFEQLTYGKYNAWEVFKDFVVLFATSLSNPVDKLHFREREDRYLRIIKKYQPEEQRIFPQLAAHTVMALEKNPEQDFLGNIFMHLDLGNDS